MPRNNTIHVRGEVAARPYFDTVPQRKTGGRIAFFKVLLDCPRDDTQPRDERHEVDRIRVVAYGKLAEALRGKVKPGDWMVVNGWATPAIPFLAVSNGQPRSTENGHGATQPGATAISGRSAPACFKAELT